MVARKRAELMEAIRPTFRRTGSWLQAGKYVTALMSDLPRRKGWTIARFAGDRLPDRTQRLLNRAAWALAAAMSTGAAVRGGRTPAKLVSAYRPPGARRCCRYSATVTARATTPKTHILTTQAGTCLAAV